MTTTSQAAVTAPTTKVKTRYLVQWLNTRTGEWITHDVGYALSPNRKCSGSYRDLKDAKWHYRREVEHRAPGTYRVIREEIVSTWTEVEV